MCTTEDPNFPSDLNIRPSTNASTDTDERFDSSAQEGAIRTYGIAGRIWEASHAMLAYLNPSSRTLFDFDPSPFTPTSPVIAVELGSGTGFVAACVAEWLHPQQDLLIATDLPEVCPLLKSNLRSCPTIRVCPLPWGSKVDVDALNAKYLCQLPSEPNTGARPLTHVLCSDLVYFPSLLAPLLRSLLHLTTPPLVDARSGHSPTVIISYKIRSLTKEAPFWSAFGLWFNFSPVLVRRKQGVGDTPAADYTSNTGHWIRYSPGDLSDETFVFVATRRPESMCWRIPQDDGELLAGVGAYNSNQPRSDDQFEQLLLMGMDI